MTRTGRHARRWHGRAALLVLSGGVALACARIEPPPGGPTDLAPPRVVSTRPDSLARLPGFKGDVEFRFDEVVSEGGSPSQGTGTGDWERLIILSPTTEVPDVTWRRSRITVRPKEGWRPDRVYRVELLPGATDLRRNRSTTGAVLTFTTGAPLPTITLQGTVVDWSTSRPAPNALVEALLLPDSLPYRGLADSMGRVALGPLPEGAYLVSGILDQNRNQRADGREAFDSVRLAPGQTSVGELWAFVHDTTPPRINEITIIDSLSASITLSQSLDARQRIGLDQVVVRTLPDSTRAAVASLLPKPADDSIHRAAAAAPAADTAKAPPPPRPGITEVEDGRVPRLPGAGRAELVALTSRPPLSDRLVLRMAQPWKPEGKYEVEVRGLRNVSGVAGDVRGALSVAKPAAARDTTAGGKDSLRQRLPKKRP